MEGVPAQCFFRKKKVFFQLPGKLGDRKQSHTQGSTLTVGVSSLGGPQDGRGMQQPACVGQDGAEPVHTVHAAAPHTPVCVSHGGEEGWVLVSGFGEWVQGGDSSWQ